MSLPGATTQRDVPSIQIENCILLWCLYLDLLAFHNQASSALRYAREVFLPGHSTGGAVIARHIIICLMPGVRTENSKLALVVANTERKLLS